MLFRTGLYHQFDDMCLSSLIKSTCTAENMVVLLLEPKIKMLSNKKANSASSARMLCFLMLLMP